MTPKPTLKAKLTESYDSFLERLVAARKKAGYSQREASRLLGKNKTYVNKCEIKERRIDIIELMEFSRLYDEKLDYFVQDFEPEYEARKERYKN